MTVEEMIAELQKLDPKMKVYKKEENDVFCYRSCIFEVDDIYRLIDYVYVGELEKYVWFSKTKSDDFENKVVVFGL